jgi:hypothetical protein
MSAPPYMYCCIAGGSGRRRAMEFYGYDDCIELRSPHARAIITPHGGARVLLYALTGRPNAIHLDDGESLGGKFENGDDARGETHHGWKWGGGEKTTGDPFGPTGGRFDVGPEFQASGPDMRQGGDADHVAHSSLLLAATALPLPPVAGSCPSLDTGT